jgi:hypothetical protein
MGEGRLESGQKVGRGVIKDYGVRSVALRVGVLLQTHTKMGTGG